MHRQILLNFMRRIVVPELHIHIKISFWSVEIETLQSDGEHESILEGCVKIAGALFVKFGLVIVDIFFVKCSQ